MITSRPIKNKMQISWRKKTLESSSLVTGMKSLFFKPVTEGWGSRVFYCLLLAVLVVTILLIPRPVAASSLDSSEKILFNIPQQRADQALIEFAEQADMTFIFSFDEAQGLTAGKLEGRYIRREALSILLVNTGLQPELQTDGALAIRSSNNQGGKDMKKFKKGFLATLISIFSATGAVGSVSANNSQVEEKGKSGTYLEEVVVTAQKRAQNILDVPVAISAFQGDYLDDIGAASLSDFLETAPGVNMNDFRAGVSQISIRGVSTDLGGNANGFYLDELPFTGVTVPLNPDVRAWDIERVEVLRGPQGTLYGEGSMGGTIRVLTRDPDMSEFQAASDFTASSVQDGDDDKGIKAMINAPIVEDVIALRLTAVDEDLGGWLDNVNTGEKDVNDSEISSYRGKLRITPSDNLDLIISGWSYDLDNNAPSAGLDAVTTTDGLIPGAAYDQYSFTGSYGIDGVGTLLYAYGTNDFLLSQTGLLFGGQFDGTIDIQIDTHELRFSSDNEGSLQWTAGLYRRTSERQDLVSFPLFGINADDRTESEAHAAFADGTWSFTDQLDLSMGVRYFENELQAVSASGVAGVPNTELDEEYSSVNPRVNLSYSPNDDWMIFATVAKGFRSGQLQPAASIAIAGSLGIELPSSLSEDSLLSYEIGAKGTLLGGQMEVEGAVYFLDWKDRVVRATLPGTPFNGLANSEGTETWGIEFHVRYAPFDGLTLQAGGNFLDATVTDDIPGTPIMGGDEVEGTSDRSFSASAQYRWGLNNGWNGFARLGAQYRTAQSNPAFPTFLPADNLTQVDARIGVEGEHWGLFLFGDNLLNDDGAITSGNPGEQTFLRPRTIGLNLKLTY
ncbi:MAG: TonB-dependent receptor [SAR92 clade bacterium]|uniref:TonB-dependent receptor n=1 Tax=SAR92 clade bacterium TaxID=2315479 RepID=A0A520MPB2_9GAMM|nr:MAG: TonB-dependent receptor [SAR92 clade bacterium]